MLKADYNDKNWVVNILAISFDNNKSINYIVKQDNKRHARILTLINYSFKVCRRIGDTFISEDKHACALDLYPDRRKTTIKSISLNIQLVFQCLSFKNIKKTLRRDAETTQRANDLYLVYWRGSTQIEQGKREPPFRIYSGGKQANEEDGLPCNIHIKKYFLISKIRI